MLWTYLITCSIIFLMLGGWLLVQAAARAFARRHPEHGPLREEGGGCLVCLCKLGGECPNAPKSLKPTNNSEL